MTIDPTILGSRLSEARSSLGLTQSEAAAATALPRTALVQIEAGRRRVSTLELVELAKLYRKHVADLLDERASAGEDPLVALGRLSQDLRDHPATVAGIRHCVELFRAGAQLETALGRQRGALPPSHASALTSHAEAAAQGIEAAERERKRLDLGDAPIADMCRLVSEQGIWATSIELPDDGSSGLFLHHPSIGMAVVVNRSHGLARKRFSYAHEFAHALFDRERTAAVTARTNANELVERRANAFAAAFLMPKGGVESLLHSLHKGGPSRRSYVTYDVTGQEAQEAEERTAPGSQELTFREVASLCFHFGVSYAAACYRLRELGHLNKTQLGALLLQQDLGREYAEFLGTRIEAPRTPSDDAEKELVAQLIPLALDAYARECISRGKLLELAGMLGLPEDQVLKFTSV